MATITTLSFNEDSKGWSCFWDYEPTLMLSLKSRFYTTNRGNLWIHYDPSTPSGNFYGTQYDSSVTLILNDNPSISKNFQTVNYEGSNGWQVDYVQTDEYFPTGLQTNSLSDSAEIIKSYSEGRYIENGVEYRIGFNRKENKYHANLVNNVVIKREGEVINGSEMSGIKGVYAEIKLSTDESTDVGGVKQLFAVSSKYVVSSY
jgi:hypothetical protein